VTLDVAEGLVGILDRPEGINVGPFAGIEQTMGALLAKLADGSATAADIRKFENTAEFKARSGTLVGQIIRLFGSGTGLSDADREFAAAISGALIEGNISEPVLRAIMAGHIENSRRDLREYNEFSKGFTSAYPQLGFAFPELAAASGVSLDPTAGPRNRTFDKDGNEVK
jgi:hypothetical protein